ncbi:unnamed protein product [Coffea canephora]|uniref:Uncharacterized protein n=1 Tax=Coffea canephora TaxID=49390 RepID=A0A068TMG5_COFCA|nr:unnamed protein product [Coffea canephora]
MQTGFSIKGHFKLASSSPSPPPAPPFALLSYHQHHHQGSCRIKIICCDKTSSSSSSADQKFNFKSLGRSLLDNSRRKLTEIDANAVQESLNHWISRTQNFLNEVTTPLVKTVNDRKPVVQDDAGDLGDIFLAEPTINSKTPSGDLSLPAIVSIEQFSRMNGLTGKKMQKIFRALVPGQIYNNARNLVEYCCFRFLSRDTSDIHPSLKDCAFRKLIFVTMVAWEHPYSSRKDSQAEASDRDSFKRKLVGEAAFVRIAPAISGVADWSTAHNLFKALARDGQGISYGSWSTYIDQLLKIHEGRKSYESQGSPKPFGEKILCLSSSRKPPVLKWENNIVWPGKLTLTDGALYFERIGLKGQSDAVRLDLTRDGSQVKRTRVGPLGTDLFDSAISVTSGLESETWVLEFVDLGGEMRRDVWYAFINEVNALHKFIQEFGPKDGDQSVYYVHGAHKGKAKAITCATNAIARLQALQHMRRLLDEPTKLVPFSFLQHAPYGDVVFQTLAVNFWAGPLNSKITDGDKQPGQHLISTQDASESSNHVFDMDGSVYLRKWMTSPSWFSNAAVAFWKHFSMRNGVVLSKNHVIAGVSLVEKAAIVCRDKYIIAEKTQATINAAMIEGIPSNIDLFKELILPLTIMANNFERLRRWEEPLVTTSFLVFVYTIIFRNMLPYLFPMTLMLLAASMLLLKGLKEQGRLGRYFGKVTIRDQPPSNTIQKIIALKQAMREVEKFMQDLNISLLKIRTIILAGQPQVTTEVALLLLLSATILLLVPFKYILAFLIFDLFTRELNFRRQMVLAFRRFLNERWGTVPAAPVVVLPYEVDGSKALSVNKSMANSVSIQGKRES